MYKLNIQILNDNGDEVLDKQFAYESLDELGNATGMAYKLSESAKRNEEADGEFNMTPDEEKFNSNARLKNAISNGLQVPEDLVVH